METRSVLAVVQTFALGINERTSTTGISESLLDNFHDAVNHASRTSHTYLFPKSVKQLICVKLDHVSNSSLLRSRFNCRNNVFSRQPLNSHFRGFWSFEELGDINFLQCIPYPAIRQCATRTPTAEGCGAYAHLVFKECLPTVLTSTNVSRALAPPTPTALIYPEATDVNVQNAYAPSIRLTDKTRVSVLARWSNVGAVQHVWKNNQECRTVSVRSDTQWRQRTSAVR